MSDAPLLALSSARLERGLDGTPRSSCYDDVYHTASGALAQARHVFLGGNGLPQRWQGRDRFLIIETGFGLGHNFLATWQAWREDPQACRRLHFVSVEKHPFHAADLTQAHAAAGVLPELSAALTQQWPMLLPGFHRLEFDEGRVVLTLMFGDAAAQLGECQVQADALYLDGFSPARNPDMWQAAVFRELARLAAPGCTLATWSVAAGVREGLAEAGFDCHKVQGFTGKREMLRGERRAPARAPAATDRRALIIGAGLAGSGIAERLAVRGWQLTLLDEAAAPAQGASGNIAGAFRPLPSADDNLLARITRAGFLYGLQDLARIARLGHPARWDACGVLHVARDARQALRQQQAVASLGAPAEFLQWLDADAASALAGQPCAQGAWWFPKGGWINPPSLCAAHIALTGSSLAASYGCRVARIQRQGLEWQALADGGEVLASAPHLILANAHDARRLYAEDWLPLRSARGQVSHVPAGRLGRLDRVVCGSGYVTPAFDGLHAVGATFQVDDSDLALRETDHAENLDKLRGMLPGAQPDSALAGRASQRPISPDRLPMVGALPGPAGLWLLSGFGARGLVWGMLCAELLAARIEGDPLPLEASLAEALAPARYFGR